VSVAAAEPRADDFGGHAIVLDWETEFLPWCRGKKRSAAVDGMRLPLPPPWKPGQHWALIGPTGMGKSTFGVGITSLRKWVVSLDGKGADTTLATAGYVRVHEMPPPAGRLVGEPKPGTDRWVWDRVAKGLPVGLVAGFEAVDDDEDEALRALLRAAISWCRRTKGWTLYVDEFELLSSQRMMRVGPQIERMLITARDAGTSVVTSFQAPAWVSKHATRQATLCTMWPTGDRDMIRNVARAMGRDWRLVAAANDALPKYHSITIPKDIHAPMLITVAPKRS
jgi:hypothetical protein